MMKAMNANIARTNLLKIVDYELKTCNLLKKVGTPQFQPNESISISFSESFSNCHHDENNNMSSNESLINLSSIETDCTSSYSSTNELKFIKGKKTTKTDGIKYLRTYSKKLTLSTRTLPDIKKQTEKKISI